MHGAIMLTAQAMRLFTSAELGQQANCEMNNARKSIRTMRRHGLIHITDWVKNSNGVAVALYQWGEGTDAIRPRKRSRREIARVNMQKRRARLIEEYGIEAARRIIKCRRLGGAEHIVIDGKSVYRRGKNPRKQGVQA